MTHALFRSHGALPYALGAYFLWGLLPLYLWLVRDVPPLEFVGWRMLFTLPVCLAIIGLRGQLADLRLALRTPRVLGLLMLSALFIGANWLIYITAVQEGHVLATSLGYYITPLMSILIGTLFLKERLSRTQWGAVALATAGVAILVWGALDSLWISLLIALTFAAYSLVRKFTPVGSVPGLTIESALLALPAAGLIAWQGAGPAGIAMGKGMPTDLFVALSGIVTAIPLLLFAVAARRLDYSVLGFCQFIAPTLVFLDALLIFQEPLRPVQLVSFTLIWTAIALFSRDLWSARQRVAAGALQG